LYEIFHSSCVSPRRGKSKQKVTQGYRQNRQIPLLWTELTTTIPGFDP
jgi:ribosomal protein L39E